MWAYKFLICLYIYYDVSLKLINNRMIFVCVNFGYSITFFMVIKTSFFGYKIPTCKNEFNPQFYIKNTINQLRIRFGIAKSLYDI